MVSEGLAWKVIDYCLVFVSAEKSFEESVRERITEGWQPTGGIVIDYETGSSIQAMVRYEVAKVQPDARISELQNAIQDIETFPEQVRIFRAKHQMTMRQMSNEIGVSASTINRAEQGKELKASSFLAIKHFIGGYNE